MSMDDIMRFRIATRDVYQAWSIEVDRLAVQLEELPEDRLDQEARRLLASDVLPKLNELKNELKSARDHLVGDLIKSVMKWEVPTLSVAFIAPISASGALAAIAGALAPAVPHVIDYFVKRRDLKHKNAMTYLLELKSLPTR